MRCGCEHRQALFKKGGSVRFTPRPLTPDGAGLRSWPEVCATTTGPPVIPGAVPPTPAGVREARCCGRAPGITPRPGPRFHHRGVPDHPQTRHPAHPTHLTYPPPVLHASIMKLAASGVRFVTTNLMVNNTGGTGMAQPVRRACPHEERGASRPDPARREILEGNGPYGGRNLPRSPALDRRSAQEEPTAGSATPRIGRRHPAWVDHEVAGHKPDNRCRQVHDRREPCRGQSGLAGAGGRVGRVEACAVAEPAVGSS